MGFFWLLFLGSLFFFRKKKRWFTYIAVTALVWLALSSTPPLPNFLVRSLEWQYQPFDTTGNTPDHAHILVLGGGHVSDERLPANDQLSEQSLKRLIEGIRIYRQLPGSTLIMSGYSRFGIPRSHAEVMAETALLLGIPAEDTVAITTPWNTMYEAIDYHRRFGSSHPLILVTSAVHMPRAMMHFQRAGLQPIPAPTNYIIKEDSLPNGLNIFPSSRNLRNMHKALHEYVGRFVGKLEWKRYLKETGRRLSE